MELASEDELRESGYHAFGTQAEVMLPKDAVVPGVVIQAVFWTQQSASLIS